MWDISIKYHPPLWSHFDTVNLHEIGDNIAVDPDPYPWNADQDPWNTDTDPDTSITWKNGSGYEKNFMVFVN